MFTLKKVTSVPVPDSQTGLYPANTLYFVSLNQGLVQIYITSSDGVDLFRLWSKTDTDQNYAPLAEFQALQADIETALDEILNGTSPVVNQATLDAALSAIRDGVAVEGNTLAKLYTLIQGISSGAVTAEQIETALGYIPANSSTVATQFNSIQNDVDTKIDATQHSSLVSTATLNSAVAAVQDGVATEGNTLAKLYALIQSINTLLTSDNANLDTLQEVVDFVETHQSDLTSLGANKLNISDVINNLTSLETAKALSAAQGKVLSDLIALKEDAITAGSANQYIKGNKTLGVFNTDVADALITSVVPVADLSMNDPGGYSVRVLFGKLLQYAMNIEGDLSDAETATSAALDLKASQADLDQFILDTTAELATKQDADVNTAKTNVAQNWTAPQRSAFFTDNDGNFNLSIKQNFKCQPSGNVTLTFSNPQDGQAGTVIFINTGGFTVSADIAAYITSSDLTKLSAIGTYRIDYVSDDVDIFCSVTGPY